MYRKFSCNFKNHAIENEFKFQLLVEHGTGDCDFDHFKTIQTINQNKPT